MGARLTATIAAGALLLGCTAGDDDAGSDNAGSEASAGSIAVPTGPAPGVTDESVTIGVTYVDLESIADIVSLDHGDYELAYQALIDAINADGGIHGRQIEAVFAPVNPVGTAGADAACLELTEDTDAFLATGFFIEDSPLCYLETHETAIVGGTMTPERLDRAGAPWFSTDISLDLQTEAIRAMDEAGDFDGTLAVYARPSEEVQMNDVVLPLLEELGVEVAETAVLDTPPDDVNAGNAATQVIAERFEAAGVDEVLAIGTAALPWATGTEAIDYRPQVLFPDANAVLAYAMDAGGRDLSVLDDAVAANLYGGSENIYELDAMQECIGVIEDAGGRVDDPAAAGDGDPETWVSAFNACNNMAVVRALLEAAGEDLNYGTLAAGAEDLEVQLPGEPEPVTYGPPPAADGDRPAHLYDWDAAEVQFVPRED